MMEVNFSVGDDSLQGSKYNTFESGDMEKYSSCIRFFYIDNKSDELYGYSGNI